MNNLVIRDVEASPMMLNKDTGEPYYSVSLKVYPDVKQNLAVEYSLTEEYTLIGKQLSEAIIDYHDKQSLQCT